ncbi:hypothetical protein CCP1ISM_160003 [Azospirillaceae bacterium]
MISETNLIDDTINFKSTIEEILKANKKQQINIMWSGGCDSTLLLYWIMDWMKTLNDDRVINAWTFTHDQLNNNKLTWERQKRNRFMIWAEDKGFKNKILNREVILPRETISIGDNACCQPAIWTSNVIPVIERDSILFAGYHRGDDFFGYSIYKNWMNLFISLNGLYGKAVKFYTPLTGHTKVDIIKYIKDINGLYENTWWCESVWDNGKQCGTCLPCKTHESALLYYEKHHNDTTKLIGETCIKEPTQDELKQAELKKVEDSKKADELTDIEIGKAIDTIRKDPELAEMVAKATTP